MPPQPDEESADDGFPWYVKAMLAIVVLVVLGIIVVDLLELAAAL